MPWVKSSPQHRTRWLCVFSFVLLLVASLGAAPEDISDLKAWAEKGDAEAQASLGVMYAKGETIPQDFSEALRWYRKAAEQGYAIAQYNLGGMYEKGQGVAQDNAEALKWIRKSAEQGLAQAQF